MNRYADLLPLAHPVSRKHPPMPVQDRAAQFAPFAALTGYEDSIGEAGRLTQSAVELTEDAIGEIDRALCALQGQIQNQPRISLTCFQPDPRKNGGTIVTVTAIAAKIEEYSQTLILKDGPAVPFSYILQLRVLSETEKNGKP